MSPFSRTNTPVNFTPSARVQHRAARSVRVGALVDARAATGAGASAGAGAGSVTVQCFSSSNPSGAATSPARRGPSVQELRQKYRRADGSIDPAALFESDEESDPDDCAPVGSVVQVDVF